MAQAKYVKLEKSYWNHGGERDFKLSSDGRSWSAVSITKSEAKKLIKTLEKAIDNWENI